MKLRNPNPWGKKSETATDQARRDIALQEIFDSFAKRFYINKPGQLPKQIIEVVKYKNDGNQVSRGVFRQESVHGETAYEIAHRIKSALAGDKDQENYLISQLKFKSLQDAQLHINVLENFYRQTHDDVINFQIQNGMNGVAGYTYNGKTRMVGFDYNLGQNVKWDPEKQIFRAFDF
jgi:hypothetical protein